MDVTEFIERLDATVDRGGLSKQTRDIYANDIKRFAEWAGLADTDTEPSAKHLLEYVDHLAYNKQLQNKSIRVRMAPVIRYARYAGVFDSDLERAWNQIRTDYKPKSQDTPSYLSKETVQALKSAAKPDSTSVLEKMPNVSRDVLSDEELRFLDDAAPGDEREYAIICLLAATGIRVGELCNLTISDVELDAQTSLAGHVSVERQKRKEKTVDKIPIPEGTASAVKAYLDVRDEYFNHSGPAGLSHDNSAAHPPSESDALFVTSSWSTIAQEQFGDGWGLTTEYARTLVSRVASRAEIDIQDDSISSVYPHLFRHTAASRLAQSGFTNVEIAGWLGVEPSTADIYADISADEMTAMAESIDS